MEGGQVIDGDLVYGRLMVEENLGALDVVALRRHMQGREAILCFGRDRRTFVDQLVNNLVVTASGCAMQWGQAILDGGSEIIIIIMMVINV